MFGGKKKKQHNLPRISLSTPALAIKYNNNIIHRIIIIDDKTYNTIDVYAV